MKKISTWNSRPFFNWGKLNEFRKPQMGFEFYAISLGGLCKDESFYRTKLLQESVEEKSKHFSSETSEMENLKNLAYEIYVRIRDLL